MAPTSIIQLTRQARGARAASRCARCSTQASPRVKSRRRERWRGNNRQVRRCESSCPRLAQARPYSLTARNSTIYAGRSCGRGLLCREGLPQADRRITTWEGGRRRDGWTRRFLRGRMSGRPAAPHRLGRCDDRDDPRTARATNSTRARKRLARVLHLLAHFGKEGEPVLPKISQETLAEMIGSNGLGSVGS